MSEKGTDNSSLGEFGLIKQLTKDIKIENASTLKGVGDDAAVLDYKDKKTIVTTDMLVEGIHFDLMYTPLKHLGYKAIAVNVSDVYAMNACPKQVTVSIAISKRFSLEAIEEFYEGVHSACEYYKVDLVGGDTTSSLTGFCISVTAIGEADADKIANGESAVIITYGRGVYWSLEAAKQFEGQIEIIDLRTLNPIDEEAMYTATKKHNFKQLNTRVHYPGMHRLSLIVNGVEKKSVEFELLSLA